MVTSFMLLGGIGLAGACGAIACNLLGRFVAERLLSQFPLGTLLINVTGACGIGLVFALMARHLITSEMQTLLTPEGEEKQKKASLTEKREATREQDKG